MNLQRLLAAWAGPALENRVPRIVVLPRIGVNRVLGMKIDRTDRIALSVPPVLGGTVSLAPSSAGREVRDAWALFLAELRVTDGAAAPPFGTARTDARRHRRARLPSCPSSGPRDGRRDRGRRRPPTGARPAQGTLRARPAPDRAAAFAASGNRGNRPQSEDR